MAFLISNISGSDQVLNDLGGRVLSTGLTDFDLSAEYSIDDIRRSQDIATLLDAGDVTAKDTTYAITKNITTSVELLLAGLEQTTDDITEGSTNVYFTNARVQSALGTLSIDDLSDIDLTGVSTNRALIWTGSQFEPQDIVNSVNGQTGNPVLDTDDISEGANLYFTNERADDRVAALIQNGTGISWAYNDGAGTLVPTISLSPFSTTDLSEGTNLYFTNERVDDRVAALIQNGTGITWTYNDGADTLTPAIGGLTTSEFASANISQWTNDANYITITPARHDRQDARSSTITSRTATGWQDLAGMTLTTANLGSTGTYLITFTCGRSHNSSGITESFRIVVGGTPVTNAQVRASTFTGEIQQIAITAVVTGISASTIIKVQWEKNGGGTHTVYERQLTIDGIPSSSVV